MLYVISPWLIYNCKFVPFNPLHPCWLPTQTPPLETTNLFSVFMFCSSWLFFDSIFKCDHTAFVFLGLISYSIMCSRFIHVIANSMISLWLVQHQYIKSIGIILMYKLRVPPHPTHSYSEQIVHSGMCVLVPQSCVTPWDCMACCLSGSSIHGILHARMRKWVAMPSCRRSSQPRDQTQISIPTDFLTSVPPRKPIEDDKKKK